MSAYDRDFGDFGTIMSEKIKNIDGIDKLEVKYIVPCKCHSETCCCGGYDINTIIKDISSE